ncbi:glutathione-s-transferase [Naegleria gruberi]|uniref:Glutathione-s-transferase n=1 Tax=Naegleria gruberi TaxID=5762 RepID=D2W0L4_NAEGR|nr:glutathione-s-transferase [Naegleria gruberi]EFC37358.1 glutathione-s-transferase [Naegleria gruberi]|eukprot:XP_002670102.1 glutathione-s-transferase [Naegleria gruberi strain NEG-M]
MVVEIVYFAGPGRSELLKLIAHVANVDYKVVGITKDEWPTHKPHTRYGQMPYLKVNDKLTIYQTYAIARYLAQQGDLYPKDNIEATQTEEYVAAIDELFNKYARVFFIAPEETREQEKKVFLEGPVKTILGALEKILEENGDGHLIKGKFTWADFVLLDMVYALQFKEVDLSQFTHIIKSKEVLKAHPRFQDYVTQEHNYRKY